MAKFEELQALAAARSKASQDKLATERAQREAIEHEKKLALETKARQDHQRERELLIAREQKRKRDKEQRKQMEIERKKMLEKREREQKEREKYGMDVVKFRNATEKAINNAGGSAKLKKKIKARDRQGQDSVSPPPNLREYSTLTREEKRKKKEAAMLGLVTSGKRKAPSSSKDPSHTKKTASATNGLVPLGTHKRDIRSVDEIERDLLESRRVKLSMQGKESQRGRLLEEEKRERELDSMLRRTKAMQEKRSLEEGKRKSTKRSDSDSSDLERRPSNGRHKEDYSATKAKTKPKPHDPKRGHTSTTSGLNPADFLPGAPIRSSIVPKAANKLQQKSTPVKSKDYSSRGILEEAGPPKKETPREKFLREEAEKKKQRERQKSAEKKDTDESEEEDESDSEEEEEEEDDSEEGESEESEEEDAPHSSKRAKVSDEIWSMFNRRDKSEYLARDIDSEDDMEADMESLRREEERSARIARLEDKREEEALRKREQEKAQRKAAKGRR